jgi:hypothetical protein
MKDSSTVEYSLGCQTERSLWLEHRPHLSTQSKQTQSFFILVPVPFYFGSSPFLFWSQSLFMLVPVPFYVGPSPFSCWSQPLFMSVPVPFYVGPSPFLCWSQSLFMLVPVPFYVGHSPFLCWFHARCFLPRFPPSIKKATDGRSEICSSRPQPTRPAFKPRHASHPPFLSPIFLSSSEQFFKRCHVL